MSWSEIIASTGCPRKKITVHYFPSNYGDLHIFGPRRLHYVPVGRFEYISSNR
jgi:hypothetical protein